MPEADENRSEMRWGLLALICAGLAVIGFVVVINLSQINSVGMRDQRVDRICRINLKQMHLSMQMYAGENPDEVYPPLSSEPGRLAMESVVIYPEYMPDPNVYLCPADHDFENRPEGNYRSIEVIDFAFDDRSYFYLGYVITSDADMDLFALAYRTTLRLLDDIALPDPAAPEGIRHLWRLRTGIERVLVTDNPNPLTYYQAMIPVMIERIGNHEPPGGYVIYMDGHVEFIEYPGKWPMTEKTVRILNELDALGAQN